MNHLNYFGNRKQNLSKLLVYMIMKLYIIKNNGYLNTMKYIRR